MTAMPTSERNHVNISNTPMQVKCDYSMDTKTVLASSNNYIKDTSTSSADTQINIFSGGWDDEVDDDEGDYVDMAPIPPKSPAISVLDSFCTNSIGKIAIEVVIEPASPHGSIASTLSMRGHSRSPSPVTSTDDSDSSDSSSDEEDVNIQTIDTYADKPEQQKTQGSSRSTIPTDPCFSPPPHAPKRQPSVAGQAARKYLQMQQMSRLNARLSADAKSSGLSRSSSRVGSGGVQSRISKNKPLQQARIRSLSEENVDSSRTERRMTNEKIDEAKRKSRTLDRQLSSAKLNTNSLTKKSTVAYDQSSSHGGERQASDGSSVMKLVTDRRSKSNSLDSKYVEYLEGLSKHASAPNLRDKTSAVLDSPKSKKLHKKEKSKKKKKKSNSDIDDEAEFRKYAATMSSKSRSSQSGSSTSLGPSKNLSSGGNLLDFANAHSREKDKSDKHTKKMHSSTLASRMSFRKSKTLGKSSTKQENSFAEAAQAFHEQLSSQNDPVRDGVENSPGNEKDKSRSNKREKRWRKMHKLTVKTRSKELINSDDSPVSALENNIKSPPTSLNEFFSNGVEEDRNAKSSPLIKQSLGYKASENSNLRPYKNSNSTQGQTGSVKSEKSPIHSPLIMSPAIARSMTLDNRKMGSGHKALQRAGSSGQIGSHPLLRNSHSLTSENSGSNSDISVVLDDEFGDVMKAKHGNKSGTLSRLLGRKAKERALEVDDEEALRYPHEMYGTGSLGRKKKHGKYATLGSPAMTLRMRHFHSLETLNATESLDKKDLFFAPKRFVHGFRVKCHDDDDSDNDSSNEFNDVAMQFEIAKHKNNKYATITAASSMPNVAYDSGSLKKRKSDANTEISHGGDSPSSHQRNKSLTVVDGPIKTKPSKGKGFGAAITRTLQRGYSGPASSHLAFNEALTEDEIVVNSTDRFTASPLRTRKLQIVVPLHDTPVPKILSAARLLYRHLLSTRPDLLQTHSLDEERDSNGPYETAQTDNTLTSSYDDSVFGYELVTWLVTQFSDDVSTTSLEIRHNACGMLQALLEDGAIAHVRKEHHFQDTYLLYQFHEAVKRPDDAHINSRPASSESTVSSSTISSDGTTSTNDSASQNGESTQLYRNGSSRSANSERWVPSIVDEQQLKEVLSYLQNVAPDAMFRMVLRKFPEDRTAEELMMIYEEILHIKALTHLSDSVKRELAGVLKFEFHKKRGKTLFSQGDEGRSWYIIVKGAVDVDIQGQGVVCTLHEGDDFGNLAIINDAPRAATIVLAEDNCQLLRVDKHDFVRILKDVEANTVRLKEHEKDVLILQKIHARSSSQNGREKYLNNNTKANQRLPVAATPTRNNHRYAISAGTPVKIIEHVVKSLRPWSTARQSDEAMEDLILMYQVFMSTQDLCKQLMNIYQAETTEQIDATKSIKRKVVYFVVRWSHIATHIFYDQPAVGSFLKELKQAVSDDAKIYPNLKEDLARIYIPEASPSESPTHRGWITVDSATIQRFPSTDSGHKPHQAVKAGDDVMLKVFNANRTYTTVRLPAISTVNEIISAVAEKQGRESENLLLIQVQSDGDMYVLPKNMTSAATSVGVNSRLFICTSDEKDDIEPLAQQHVLAPTISTVLELVGSLEIAEHITQLDWELINSIHVMEFVHKVFGSHKFHSVTSNIDIFARRFNQLAYWAPTEICACNNLNKRVHLLRKFIKIAQHLKELQNMNAFMAVMIGLGNQALSRLHGTWDKLPTKYKKLMTEFEAVLDPSRNHRVYRLHVAGLRPPLIPYLPLLMKDMTFQHEGNASKRNGLINFEKMHMMSNSIRAVIQACGKPFEMSHAFISAKSHDDSRHYTRNFAVMTDQKQLNELSGKIEGKR